MIMIDSFGTVHHRSMLPVSEKDAWYAVLSTTLTTKGRGAFTTTIKPRPSGSSVPTTITTTTARHRQKDALGG